MIAGAWLCLAAPLAGALLITLCGTRIPRRAAGWLSTASVFVAFAGAVWSFFGLRSHGSEHGSVSTAWTWLEAGNFKAGMSVLADPLSTMMMLIVSGVGGLIVLYSIGYMDGDDEERRYFAYMSFFVFSMLLLVEGGNLLMLLAGWGLVGLSSYLLIGFWHERPTAIAAAKKAFVMNAFGDATMALAFFVLIAHSNSLDFATSFATAGHLSQTTVGLVALVQTDIKRVIAYSTMSQIGYMFLGVGIGAYANGMFHLMTHAYFKALLFLAAGVLIHMLGGEQDIRKMSGIGAFAPWTRRAFLIGSLALVGVPPFAGFFSKDSIIAAAFHDHWYGVIFWVVALIGTFLTGLYTFRLYFIVFRGEPSAYVREHHHAHGGEGPMTMLVPVWILAVLSVVGGWIQFAPLWHPLTNWLGPVARTLGVAEPRSWDEALASVLAVALGLAGIGVAYLVYARRRVAVPSLPAVQRVLAHKLYFDEAYDTLFYRPAAALATLWRRDFEEPVVLAAGPDLGETAIDAGRGVRRIQTGLLRTYVLFLGAGMAVVAIVFLMVR